jgi:O-Antigen ligase
MNSLNSLLAFAWVVAIGTNGLNYYSGEAPYQAAVILVGAAYISIVFQRELLRLVSFKVYLLVLLMLALPILLMLLSERSFDRGAYMTVICVGLVFVVTSVLALRSDLDGALTMAAFVIVAVGAALNLYELFFQNNVWSIATGRSAGFYINPNTSSEALLAYGLIFLTARMGKLRIVDLILMALVVVGVFVTFSRGGIVAGLVLITGTVLMRVQRGAVPRLLVGAMAISLLAFAFSSYVVDNLDLSTDAKMRIDSLVNNDFGAGDYEKDRGLLASEALEVFEKYPLFGAGVQASDEMPIGPHNMFLAMMVNYGVGGLVLYLAVIIRLILIARREDRSLSSRVLAFVAWLVILGFGSHNLLDNSATIPFMGLALARAFQIEFLRKESQFETLISQETIPCGY